MPSARPSARDMKDKLAANLATSQAQVGCPSNELKPFNQIEQLQVEVNRLNRVVTGQEAELLNLYRRLLGDISVASDRY